MMPPDVRALWHTSGQQNTECKEIPLSFLHIFTFVISRTDSSKLSIESSSIFAGRLQTRWLVAPEDETVLKSYPRYRWTEISPLHSQNN
jgi:hypothetical protein